MANKTSSASTTSIPSNTQNPIVLPRDTAEKYCIIGAGPAGMSGAKALKDKDIPFDGFEMGVDFGGLWNIENPKSTIYESAHLISSKTMTEFKDFPMSRDTPDYPNHRRMCAYFKNYAAHFKLYDHFFFNTKVLKVEKMNSQWMVTIQTKDTQIHTFFYKGVIIANGTLSEPNLPNFEGSFDGELIHSSQYKNASIFDDKRVLVIGAGNSGCDIVVDAVHRAKKVDISVRRGYYFVPKYVFGKPSDTIGGKIKLPRRLKQLVDNKLLKWFTGDPERFGFPKPSYRIYESHPVINTLILHHIGQGDVTVRGDIKKLEKNTVYFKDLHTQEYDMIVAATGYKLHFPFIEKKHLNWDGYSPQLYLNIFHPEYDNLFVLGMVEAAGLGWEGRYEQSKLMANYIKGIEEENPAALKFQQKKKGNQPDLSGGFSYLKLARMSYYVHKDTYRNLVTKEASKLA